MSDSKKYKLNDEVTLNVDGQQIAATVDHELDDNGKIGLVLKSRVNGKIVIEVTPDQLDRMVNSTISSEELKHPENNPSTPLSFLDYGIGIGCWILPAIAIACFIFFMISENNKKKKLKAKIEQVKDSVAKDNLQRIKLYEDSIKAVRNTKEYKDSVEAAEKMEQEMEDRMTVVIFAEGDSLFHYSTECSMLDNNSSMQLMTQKKAKHFGKSICPECYDREDVYCGYTSGDYIHIDELPLDDY